MRDITYIGGGRQSGRTTKLVALATYHAETNPDSMILFVTHQMAETDRILRLLATAAHLTVRIERTVYSGRRSIGYTNGARVKIVAAQGLDNAWGYKSLIMLADNTSLYPPYVRDHLWEILAPLGTPIWYSI